MIACFGTENASRQFTSLRFYVAWVAANSGRQADKLLSASDLLS